MAVFRIPYPADPARRQALQSRALAALARFGSATGTTESGTFRGKTPVGEFAGSYRADEATGELEVTVDKKPFLVPIAMIESEARKFVSMS